MRRTPRPTHLPPPSSIGEIIDARIGRRAVLGGVASTIGLGALAAPMFRDTAHAAGAPSTLTFQEIPHGLDETHHVAPGYDTEVLIRWGDAVETGAPPFDPNNQTVAAQRKQFGYNNDFIGFLPLPTGSDSAERGLLCVNHEFTISELMFPGVTPDNRHESLTREHTEIEMAAHGHSVVEVVRRDGRWRLVRPGRYNRRITALDTNMRLAGPAAGHRRLRTSGDPSGRWVIGTLSNCAGGITPWGTVLISEENFDSYFHGDRKRTPEARNHAHYGVGGPSWHPWWRYHDRFNVEKEPNEANRFGWIVEFDPYDRQSVPVKRTALGRFQHEGATTTVNPDGRVVVYSGDDAHFQYIYKFVSHRHLEPGRRTANATLLDIGTLSVARFNADGTLDWLPLVHGHERLTPEHGFHSQADISIETRRAAKLLGATPMDRPEDIETNPVTGVVYVMLTSNSARRTHDIDAANPRAHNRHGHVLELIPPGGRGKDADHSAQTYRWEISILCGDPSEPSTGARYNPNIGKAGWFSGPDNCTFDSRGRLWIATDGAAKSGFADGLWAMDVEGPGRGLTRHFLRTPQDAELCGPCFTPDDRTLFCSVQHPAADRPGASTFDAPSTRWPDFDPTMPPRPAVLAITKNDGSRIGG